MFRNPFKKTAHIKLNMLNINIRIKNQKFFEGSGKHGPPPFPDTFEF